jgi:hypothetical protein
MLDELSAQNQKGLENWNGREWSFLVSSLERTVFSPLTNGISTGHDEVPFVFCVPFYFYGLSRLDLYARFASSPKIKGPEAGAANRSYLGVRVDPT